VETKAFEEAQSRKAAKADSILIVCCYCVYKVLVCDGGLGEKVVEGYSQLARSAAGIAPIDREKVDNFLLNLLRFRSYPIIVPQVKLRQMDRFL